MRLTSYTLFVMMLFAGIRVSAQIDGSLDLTFDPGIGPNTSVGNLAVLPDGKVMICLGFTKYNNINRSEIARINTDGTLDQSFDPGQGAMFGNVRSIVVQPDGKMIFGGTYTNYNNTYSDRLTRVFPDGKMDTTFRTSTAVNGEVNVLALQSDGKVLVGGAFTAYKGHTSKNLARVMPNGEYDSTFKVGTGPNDGSSISAIQILPDGKIIVAGDFSQYNGVSIKRIIRVNQDGSLDTTFKTPNLGSSLLNAVVQPDGKIIITGFFGNVNGVPAPRIARLNSDGTLDTSFKADVAPYPFTVGSVAIQPDGKLLICPDNGFMRLNVDGSRDSSFNGGVNPVGVNGGVKACKLLPDGRPMIVGSFTTYNTETRNHIARLKGPFGTGIKENTKMVSKITVYPNPASGTINFEEAVTDLVVTDMSGKVVLTHPALTTDADINGLTPGIYFIRAKQGEELITGKVVIK
jgi:uncharacterized delta-60 repeat protein